VAFRSGRRNPQEEGEYEYVSDHQGGKEGHAEAHIEPAVLYQPLPEAASSEGSAHEQPGQGGDTHEVSGDGCGDGGYCGGHWVRRSEKVTDMSNRSVEIQSVRPWESVPSAPAPMGPEW
jgi:hypothetical protein